jgi:hypothetical protein
MSHCVLGIKKSIRYIDIRGYILILILIFKKENESDLYHPPVFYKI